MISPNARIIRLDQRLSAVAQLFEKGCVGADIGTDHGMLPAYLLQHDICRYMYVSDISEIALSKAKKLIKSLGLQDRASFVHANGFSGIPSSVECVSICGLGGETIANIIKNTPETKPKLIMSAHTKLPHLRRSINDIGYLISREIVARAAGRYYVIIEALNGSQILSDKELELGFNMHFNCKEDKERYFNWRFSIEKKKRLKNNNTLEWINEELNYEASKG